MKKYLISENGDVHGFLVTETLESREDAQARCAELEGRFKGYSHKVHEVSVNSIKCSIADYDEEETTVIVTVTANVDGEDAEAKFHVQTTEGRYSAFRGCWIITNGVDHEFSETERLIFESSDVAYSAEEWLSVQMDERDEEDY